MKRNKFLVLLLFTLFLSINNFAGNLKIEKPRLLVLTDIGGDPDDTQALVRLLAYANEFRIEGLIATPTSFRDKTDPNKFQVNENLIYDVINNYALVRDNLLLNSAGYPTSEELHSKVKCGQMFRSVSNLSPGQTSTGSQQIIKVVDSSDEPLCIVIWGGAFDLAQALLNVKTERSAEEVDRFISKLRVFAINDQDITFAPKGTGEWIYNNFPNLWYIETGPSWMLSTDSSFRGMYQNDSKGGRHPTLPIVKPGIEKLNNKDWVKSNINNCGALGAGYPSHVYQNPGTARNTQGVKEGDTPSWFYFLLNGLNDINHPEWGGWGGRYEHLSGKHFTDAQDDHWSGNMDGSLRHKWTVARWREAFQNDFAARMQWCILPYGKTNHNPIAIIDEDSTKDVLFKTVKMGQEIKIDAKASFDPDGNKINYKWWIYHEISSTDAIIKKSYGNRIVVKTSKFSPEGEIHVILEVTDDGIPKLFAYRRIIIKVISESPL